MSGPLAARCRAVLHHWPEKLLMSLAHEERIRMTKTDRALAQDFGAGVDSGQLLIIDPGYLRNEGITDTQYYSIMDATIARDCGTCFNPLPLRPDEPLMSTENYLGFAFATGRDGNFPITVKRNEEGEITKVIINVRSEEGS